MKLAIFDKDGTLTTPASGAKFVQTPEDQVLIPGVADLLSVMSSDGWQFAIASNQGGIEAGHKSMADAIEEMRIALELTGIPVAYFCPAAPGSDGHYCMEVHDNGRFYHKLWDGQSLAAAFGDSDALALTRMGFRKPNPGMLLMACTRFTFRPQQILFVGDRPEDQQAAAAVNFDFMWTSDCLAAI